MFSFPKVLDTASKRAKALERLIKVYLSKLEERHLTPTHHRPAIDELNTFDDEDQYLPKHQDKQHQRHQQHKQHPHQHQHQQHQISEEDLMNDHYSENIHQPRSHLRKIDSGICLNDSGLWNDKQSKGLDEMSFLCHLSHVSWRNTDGQTGLGKGRWLQLTLDATGYNTDFRVLMFL